MSRFGDLVKGKVSAPAPKPVVEETPPRPEEEVADAVNLSGMSKKQLERYGRERGIELDRRHSKVDLINELKDVL